MTYGYLYLPQLMKALMTKADNAIFAHYIFMDNEFFLPTVTGVPLRIALSGTFTPGIKGGLKIARDMVNISKINPTKGFYSQLAVRIPLNSSNITSHHLPFIHRMKLPSCHLLALSLLLWSVPTSLNM